MKALYLHIQATRTRKLNQFFQFKVSLKIIELE